MTRDANTALARAFVDEWVRAGVEHAVLAPGSRSTPLALALAADDRLRLHVHLDERSAAFFALGTAKATGRPAIVLCTSGTAAANFHPAVLEARHSRVPLVVCTADRPPELRDAGAGQTVDQLKLYGDAVRWFCEVGAPEDRPGAGAAWRAIAARSVAAATGRPPGPVHLNLAFREPLVPTGDPLVDAPGRDGGAPVDRVDRFGAQRARRPHRRPARRRGARVPVWRARGRLGRGRDPRDGRRVRGRDRLARARGPAVGSPRGRQRRLHVRRAAARPVVRGARIFPTSSCASVRR